MCGYKSSFKQIRGTWVYKGTINASTFPEFPKASTGDVYLISGKGFVGDSDLGPGLKVERGDVVHCINDTEGGIFSEVQSNWNTLQGNIDTDLLEFNQVILPFP